MLLLTKTKKVEREEIKKRKPKQVAAGAKPARLCDTI